MIRGPGEFRKSNSGVRTTGSFSGTISKDKMSIDPSRVETERDLTEVHYYTCRRKVPWLSDPKRNEKFLLENLGLVTRTTSVRCLYTKRSQVY